MIGKVQQNSPIRKLDVRSRLALFGIAFPVSAFIVDYRLLLIPSLLLILIIIAIRIKVKHIIRNTGSFCAFLLAFLFLASVTLVEGSFETRILTWIVMSIRFSVAVISSSLLSLIARPEEIAYALLKSGLPHPIGMSVMLAFRFFPILLSKASTIRYSLKFRGVSLRVNPLKIQESIRDISFYFVAVFATTVEMGVMLGETMVGRGYSLHRPITISPELRLKSKDFAIISCSAIFILLSYLSRYSI